MSSVVGVLFDQLILGITALRRMCEGQDSEVGWQAGRWCIHEIQ
jgi:hypothetical protein